MIITDYYLPDLILLLPRQKTQVNSFVENELDNIYLVTSHLLFKINASEIECPHVARCCVACSFLMPLSLVLQV